MSNKFKAGDYIQCHDEDDVISTLKDLKNNDIGAMIWDATGYVIMITKVLEEVRE